MDKKIGLLLGVLAFGLLLWGAYFAYNRLQHLQDDYAFNIQDHSRAHAYSHANANAQEYSHDDSYEYAQSNLQQAPDFAVYDELGNEVRLSDFLGSPVVLNFWATWCPSCVNESPYFEELHQNMGDEIEILKVVLLDGQRETRNRVDAFMEENGYTFPLFFDSTGEAANAYGVTFIPVTFFINAEGYVAAGLQGAANSDVLRQGVDIILASHQTN